MSLRNLFFSLGIFKIRKHDIIVISVGNIRVGGTGKTPMVDYLANSLQEGRRLAILSRGYGRKTKGFKEVVHDSKPMDVGEEMLMLKRRNGDKVIAAVDENRNRGAEKLRSMGIDTLILDDAFQHRYIHRDLNILLSDFNQPFFKDQVIPSGRLREFRTSASRADALIFSKTPSDIELERVKAWQKKAEPYLNKETPIFFSYITAGNPIPISGSDQFEKSKELVLVSGIANPIGFEDLAEKFGKVMDHFVFPDHAEYSLKKMKPALSKAESGNSLILTTEKDAIKLLEIEGLSNYPIFYLPIGIGFHDFGTNFDSWLRSELRK